MQMRKGALKCIGTVSLTLLYLTVAAWLWRMPATAQAAEPVGPKLRPLNQFSMSDVRIDALSARKVKVKRTLSLLLTPNRSKEGAVRNYIEYARLHFEEMDRKRMSTDEGWALLNAVMEKYSCSALSQDCDPSLAKILELELNSGE